MAKRMCGGACPWTDWVCPHACPACEWLPCSDAKSEVAEARDEAMWFAFEMAEAMEEDEE